MLTRTVNTTKQVPVEVIHFKWSKPVTNPALYKLPCTACRGKIGDKRWGLAFVLDKDKTRLPMRLCEKCGLEAEQTLKETE